MYVQLVLQPSKIEFSKFHIPSQDLHTHHHDFTFNENNFVHQLLRNIEISGFQKMFNAHMIIACKISAANLHKMEAPTLLNHCKLHPTDHKAIWDTSYKQEYQGLVDIDTWECITEEEYKQCKHIFWKFNANNGNSSDKT